MKKLFVFIGLLGILSLSSCNRKGCPNQLDADHPEKLEEVN